MILTITGVCFVSDGKLLTVRKKNTSKYMLVGGKLEPGETPVQAASREILEEVDLMRTEDQLELLGEFDEDAANEPGWRVSSPYSWPSLSPSAKPQASLPEQR